MKSTFETRILLLPIHDALVNPRAPSYLGAYECGFDQKLSELTGVESKSAYLVDTGIQLLRNNFVW
jgi:hypothetical protein